MPGPSDYRARRRAEALRQLAQRATAPGYAAQKRMRKQRVADLRAGASEALRGARRVRRPAEVLDRLSRGEAVDVSESSWLAEARDLLGDFSGEDRQAARRLIEQVDAGRLLSPSHRGRYRRALGGLVRHRPRWLADPATWRRPGRRPELQATKLAAHLLARYPVPAPFRNGWFSGDATHQGWYVHLGQGSNLRTAVGLPMPLTKRMVHHALQAPPDLDPPAALRWGEVHALGGDARVARGVLSTFLADTFAAPAFWRSVIRFFVAEGIDPVHYGPVCDYLQHLKFTPGPEGRPLQPDLCMRGRTAPALLRQVRAWHRALGKSNLDGAWSAPAVEPLRAIHIIGGAPIEYHVIPLVSTRELVVEGQRLRHCVASYASRCRAGLTSIWSVRKRLTGGRIKRLATLELATANRSVIQARARKNRVPSGEAWDQIDAWCRLAGVRVSPRVPRV